MGVRKMWNVTVPKPKQGGGKYWQNVGKIMEFDDGRMSLKLDAMPVGMVADKDGNSVPFDGWFSVFEDDGSRGNGGTQTGRSSGGQSNSSGGGAPPY